MNLELKQRPATREELVAAVRDGTYEVDCDAVAAALYERLRGVEDTGAEPEHAARLASR